MIVFHVCRDFNIITVAQNGNCLLICDFFYESDMAVVADLGFPVGLEYTKMSWGVLMYLTISSKLETTLCRKHGFITGALYKISAKLHRPREK